MCPGRCVAVLTLLWAAVMWPAVADLRCALLCRSLAEACQRLGHLYINTDLATSQAVLDGLLQAQLGSDSDGRPRHILLHVPGR